MRYDDYDSPGLCACGASAEDCGGGCYPWSLTQLLDPATGQNTMPADYIDSLEMTVIGAARYWGRWTV